MNGVKLLLDTNIVIYFLSGDEFAKSIIAENDICISVISEMELLSYPKLEKKDIEIIKKLLSSFEIINLSDEIKTLAITIKRENNLKLPDSIILATSVYMKAPLVTADKKMATLENFEIINYSNG